ncbi:unnamed protein product [Spirodela intermedia]|uniref:Peroxiredoxin n=1 Tax=Spirodela intermedia TaxID=51605 RepID=A0A7I8JWV7_SPIIN|nr:unnamed protein product [Spirodela intermedia]
MPGLTIGDTIPNLEVDTTHGRVKLHDFVGDSWAVIFSHPGDFTPVCTTELGRMALQVGEFEKRRVKLLGVSCEDVKSHLLWIKDIEHYTPGCKVTYPIVADPDRDVIRELNMVDPDKVDEEGFEIPNRALHVISPDKKIQLSIVYPATTGRNMDEVLRVVDLLQAAAAARRKAKAPPPPPLFARAAASKL